MEQLPDILMHYCLPMQRSICLEHELFFRYWHVRLVRGSAASMAAAQSQKRFKKVKAAGPGLYYHDGAHAGFHSSGLAFSTSIKKLFSCLQACERPERTSGRADICPNSVISVRNIVLRGWALWWRPATQITNDNYPTVPPTAAPFACRKRSPLGR